ncbi:MAG: hypothetical protein AAFU85_08475 [Planctomycetota bacterium]
MPNLSQLQRELLADRRITPNEVAKIRTHIESDGKLDFDDVKFLCTILSEAEEVCSEFDELFFPALRRVLLADGTIDASEHFQLLRMLYGTGTVRESEARFLRDLRTESLEVSPEFEQLCTTVLGESREGSAAY